MPNSLTPNYSLAKPDPLDNYDVAVPNGNMDLIDAALKANANVDAAQGTDITNLLNHMLNINSNLKNAQIGLTAKSGAVSDANGFYTLTHGFGFTPDYVLCWGTSPASYFAVFWGADTITATTVRTRWMNSNGGPLASLGVGSFVALGIKLV